MEQAGDRVITVGSHRYRLVRMARLVHKYADRMWGSDLHPDILRNRLAFEAPDTFYSGEPDGDGGDFTPRDGASIRLGKWNEKVTVGIALHELAHEMHLVKGGYTDSDDILREALALLVEREMGIYRSFEYDPYYTASHLVAQLDQLWMFHSLPFRRRWNELVTLSTAQELADLVNYYLDRNEGLGLHRWLQQYGEWMGLDARDEVLELLSECSLRYSLDYRRTLIRNLVRCHIDTPVDKILNVLDAVIELDERHPDDDMGHIINFCFTSLPRTRWRLLPLVG